MLATLATSSPRPANFRRLCSWCHCDLGPLAQPINHDSYAICQPCQHRYFDYLYEVDVVEQRTAEVLLERTVGA